MTKNLCQTCENYDICINSDGIGVEKAAELICEMVNKKTGILL